MDNITYTNLKDKLEKDLVDLEDAALVEKNEAQLDAYIDKIQHTTGKLNTLEKLFKKINLDSEGRPVLKDSTGAIQWRF